MSMFLKSAETGASPKIEIFDREITPVGWLDRFSSLQCIERPSKKGYFELWCPIDLENLEKLQPNNLLWLGETRAWYIESMVKQMTEEGLQMQVKGMTLEGYLEKRIIWGQFINYGILSNVMREAVRLNAINPINPNRRIPLLGLSTTQINYGSAINFQNTGGNLHDILEKTTLSEDLGWEVQFDPFSKSLTFVITQGVDRTVNNPAENDPVVFDSDMDDILASSYYLNLNDHKNVALVAGSGEGSARKTVTVNDAVGLDRRELYVDARDLSDMDENQNPIPDPTYLPMLTQRGTSKLSEYPIVETFDSQIRVDGGAQYLFGVDYSLGDWVTVKDRKLGVDISAKIMETQKTFTSDGYGLMLTFGYTQPQLNKMISRMLE